MRAWLLLLGLTALAVVPVLAADDDACDMKTIEKMRYCENDELILDKTQLVSNHKYYVCESCGMTYAEKGNCPDCEEPLVEKVSGKDACKICYGPTIEVDVCVKKCWICPDCEMLFAKAGKCPDCETKLKEHVSRALVVYECPECGMTSHKAGNCTSEDCEAKGKPLVKRCGASGEFPHGGSAE